MKELENRINSVELCEIINKFRKEEIGPKAKEMRHDSLMAKITKEIKVMKKIPNIKNSLQNFLESTYTNSRGKTYPCFSLNASGMRQILNSESVYVRVKTEEYITKLEERNRELQNTDISLLIKRIESLEEQVKILSASPNNYKEFKSLTEWLKGYNIPTTEANKILVELGIMKKDKEGFHLSDYCPTTWGVPKPIQGVLRIYWSAIGFGKIIPKIQKKWDQKKLVSGQYEQAKMEI